MRLSLRMVALFLLVASISSPRPLDDATLKYFNVSGGEESHFTLRHRGGEVQIVEDRTGEVVAHAAAEEVRRVVFVGRGGDHKDTLTVDFAEPLDLPDGVDYDGGAKGFDTLVLGNGRANAVRADQQTPNDGVIDVDRLRIRYSNLEPVTDTVAAATLTVTGSAGNDVVTITSGPAAGQMTISSAGATFESVTFSNKTAVTFSGGGGTDSVSWDATTLASGLTTFIITNVDSVTQTQGITVPGFAASAANAVTLTNAANEVDNLELSSTAGSASFTETDAVTIGGVTAGISGIAATAGTATLAAGGSVTQGEQVVAANLSVTSTSGSITLTNAANDVGDVELSAPAGAVSFTDVDDFNVGNVDGLVGVSANGAVTLVGGGTITLADATSSAQMVLSTTGNITITANGAASDIAATADKDAITAQAGSIQLTAGRDILLGTAGADYDNDVRASGNVTMNAGRTIEISGFADVASDDFGLATGGDVSLTAVTSVEITNSTGLDASAGANGAAGGNVTLTTSAAGTVELSAGSSATVYSSSGDATIVADHLLITSISGVTASSGVVTISSVGGNIDLGSATDAAVGTVEISDPEFDRLFTPVVVLASTSGSLTVTAAIDAANTSELVLSTGGVFTSTGGSLTETTLTFTDTGAVARTWAITPTTITIGAGSAITYTAGTLNANGGSGGDTFNVDPSTTTTFNIDGNAPLPPTGDTLDVDLTGTTATLTVASNANGSYGSWTFTSGEQPVAFQEIEALADQTDLNITKTDGASEAVAGEAISYTIVVTNQGTFGVVDATVTDTFPAQLTGVTWTCAAQPGATCTAAGSGNISDTVDLPAGSWVTYSVSATIDPSASPGSLTNTATVAPPSGLTDSDTADNSATDTDTLVTEADVSITKTSDIVGTVNVGDEITYTITVNNAGPSDAQLVTVTDVLPEETTLVSATPSQGTCAGTTTVTCDMGTLAAGASATVTIVVEVTSAPTDQSISNTASVSSPTDVTGGNNSSAVAIAYAVDVPSLSTVGLALLAALLAIAAALAMRRL